MDSAKSVLDAATVEYFAWLRQILTLSSTSLTVLIALRSQLVPEHPQSIWLLQLTWIALMIAIASALWGTAGYHKVLMRLYVSHRRAEQIRDQTSEMIPVPRFYLRCGKIAPFAFLVALLSLGVFGVLNIGTHSVNKPATLPAGTTAPAIPLGLTDPIPNTPHNTPTNASPTPF